MESGETVWEHERRRMVERQLRARGVEDERVLEAMATVPRERFVPEAERPRAYDDGALRIGEGQTISQPWIVASMAALLELDGDERVLEIGTGSGYAAAVLSRLCREVVTIERHPSLAATARAVIASLGYDNVEVRQGDGTRGAPDRAPFDAISITATARERPPEPLRRQLTEGGVLVCPVASVDGGEQLMRFRAGAEEAIVPVRFVPLVPGAEPPEGAAEQAGPDQPPGPDAEPPGPDAEPPGPRAEPPEPETESPGPDAEPPEPETGPRP